MQLGMQRGVNIEVFPCLLGRFRRHSIFGMLLAIFLCATILCCCFRHAQIVTNIGLLGVHGDLNVNACSCALLPTGNHARLCSCFTTAYADNACSFQQLLTILLITHAPQYDSHWLHCTLCECVRACRGQMQSSDSHVQQSLNLTCLLLYPRCIQH